MKSDNLAAVEFIRACALANKHVRDFSNAVRGMPGVMAVSASQDMFGQDEQEWPESPIGVAWYVDAELDDGSVVCWVLDVTWEKSTWTISRELTVPGKQARRPSGPSRSARRRNCLSASAACSHSRRQ